jgi:predicted transcriptional regulator
MSRTSLEDKKIDFRIIYEELNRDFRIFINDLAESLQVNRTTARRRLNEAFEKGYIEPPQIRKRSFENFKEYIFFLRCENPNKAFKQLKNDKNVVYHSVLKGFANLLVISTQEYLDIDGERIVTGRRSDYYCSFALNRSWNEGIIKMEDMVKNFNPKDYTPKGIIQTHWNEILDWWDSEFETLYRELKYDGREKYTPIMEKQYISSSKTSQFFKMIHVACTVTTRYFPEGLYHYDQYLFMFETEYEDFIIELFSQLPTSSFFFKCADKLFVDAFLKKESIRHAGPGTTDISQMRLLCLLENLLERGIIINEKNAIFAFHWKKDL